MWRIQGQGNNQIKLLDVCRPVLLLCSIGGGKQVSSTGRHLHGLYVFDFGKVRPAVTGFTGDKTDTAMKVEFDLNGPIHLNHPGALYITDGDPTQFYDINASICECPTFHPTWHPLTTRITNGNFIVPKYHSRISTLGPAVSFTVGQNIGTLDHIPIPITGDDILFLGGGVDDATIVTEWWG